MTPPAPRHRSAAGCHRVRGGRFLRYGGYLRLWHAGAAAHSGLWPLAGNRRADWRGADHDWVPVIDPDPQTKESGRKMRSAPFGAFLFPNGGTPVLNEKPPAWVVFFVCAPMEIRTPALALKGPRPGPLDDGGILWTERQDFTIPSRTGQAIDQTCFLSVISASKSTWRRLNRMAGLSMRSCGIRMAVSVAL